MPLGSIRKTVVSSLRGHGFASLPRSRKLSPLQPWWLVVRPHGLTCPACSSHGIRPSQEQFPVDKLFRIFGRAPYDCLWCGKRCFLVMPDKGPDLPGAASTVVKPDATPLPDRVVPPHRSVPDAPPSRNVSEAPPSRSVPDAPLPSGVPDAPMYAEKGRLRLSEMTLDQIQWRGERLGRPAVVGDSERNNTKRPKS